MYGFDPLVFHELPSEPSASLYIDPEDPFRRLVRYLLVES